MMATGNETMEDLSKTNDISLESARVETIILPPETEEETVQEILPEEPEAPVMMENEPELIEEVWQEGDTVEVAAPMYIWPVQGELERYHQMDSLAYDVTMRDWRTHEGVDIAAALGSTVAASRSGSVQSIVEDDLYGTVVSIDHGDGSMSVYANLASVPTVNVGDWVESGQVIGSVGTTALCEIGQGTHLHFAMYVNGESVDPLSYLPA